MRNYLKNFELYLINFDYLLLISNLAFIIFKLKAYFINLQLMYYSTILLILY